MEDKGHKFWIWVEGAAREEEERKGINYREREN